MIPPRVRTLSAITLATADMARAVAFYEGLLGLHMKYGGADAAFTSFAAGDTFFNLIAQPHGPVRDWGRVIFHVDDVDAMYERLRAAGHAPEAPPRDASWGERFFHVRDPDGHEVSIARPL